MCIAQMNAKNYNNKKACRLMYFKYYPCVFGVLTHSSPIFPMILKCERFFYCYIHPLLRLNKAASSFFWCVLLYAWKQIISKNLHLHMKAIVWHLKRTIFRRAFNVVAIIIHSFASSAVPFGKGHKYYIIDEVKYCTAQRFVNSSREQMREIKTTIESNRALKAKLREKFLAQIYWQ